MGAVLAFASPSVRVSPFTGDIINQFIAGIDVADKSKRAYRQGGSYFMDWLQKENIEWPERADILRYKDSLRVHQANTISAYMAAVRCLFTWLESVKLFPNIAAGVKGAKTVRGFRKDIFTLEQIKGILSGIDRQHVWGIRDVAMLNLMVRTGLRTIEVSRANIDDIKTEGGETVLYVQGKGRDAKDEFVLLSPSVVDVIADYLTVRGDLPGNAPLFAAHDIEHNGNRLSADAVSSICKKRLRAAGIDSKRLTAHSFRHTAITMAIQAGASIMEVKEMARHSNINTTLIYARVLNRVTNAPEKRIDEMLGRE